MSELVRIPIKIPVKINKTTSHFNGEMRLPLDPKGLVIFAHGSGSSRFSPRNQQVAESLNHAALGTMLFDLLTKEEAKDREAVFNIEFLADRLEQATDWAKQSLNSRGLSIPVGYFGASTGAGAALWASAQLKNEIAAIVSRGGRPDLALDKLGEVTAPTLLLVGEKDEPVIEMNEEALTALNSTKQLVLIPNATHLFDEPGALEAVSAYARAWFIRYFEEAYSKNAQTGSRPKSSPLGQRRAS